MGITGMCVCNLKLCMPIAIRYSAVRRQFGPKDTEEIPVIEYQLQVHFKKKSSLFIESRVSFLMFSAVDNVVTFLNTFAAFNFLPDFTTNNFF